MPVVLSRNDSVCFELAGLLTWSFFWSGLPININSGMRFPKNFMDFTASGKVEDSHLIPFYIKKFDVQ